MTFLRPAPQRRTGRTALLLFGILLLALGTALARDLTDESTFYPGLYYPAAADSSGAEPITLRPGESFSEIQFALTPSGGRISGRVLGEAMPQPIPLPGVLVEAVVAGRRILTRSGADGAFLLTGVPAGDALVRFATDDPLSREVHYQAGYYTSSPGLLEGTPIRVNNGETRTLADAVLPLGCSFTGIVRAEDTSLPMGRTLVRVESRAPLSAGWTTRTSADGRFLIGGLPGGSFVVQVVPEGSEYIPVYYNGSRTAEGATALDLGPGQTVPDLDMKVPRGGILWGEIRRETGVGYVGLAVQATHLGTNAVYVGYTYGFGQFRVIGLPAGEYQVYVPHLRKYYDRSGEGTYDRNRAYHIPVAEGQDVFDINLTGSPRGDCSLPPVAQGAIVGRIRGDLTGADRIVVRVYSAADTTDHDIELGGDYTIGCLTGGQYRVALLANGPVAAQFYPRQRLIKDALPVSVAQGDTVRGIDFNAEQGVHLAGHVRDAVSGQPLVGARIHALEIDTGIAVVGQTDSLGDFAFDRLLGDPSSSILTGLPAGRWRVSAESTIVQAPSLTPILQPRLNAGPGDPGMISLEARLAQGMRWCYLVARFESASAPQAPGGGSGIGGGIEIPEEVIVARGEMTPAGSEDVLQLNDLPPGAGPYRYLLLAWPSSGACGDPPAGSVFSAESEDVAPAPKVDEPEEIGLAAVRAFPIPWTGAGNLRFLAGSPLRKTGQLQIFSAAGAEVASLHWPAGERELAWQVEGTSSRPLPNGIYLWSLREGGARRASGGLLLLR
jgi:hypothetical protein